MGNEIFLIILTLAATLTVKREQFPALIYMVFAFLVYFASLLIDNTLHLLKVAAISEMCLVGMLYCMKDCLNSSLVKWLIPVSISMILVHFFGWNLEYNNQPLYIYNTLVYVYWSIVMALFLTVGRMNGNRVRNTRFLRDVDGEFNLVGKVYKKW